MILKELPLVMQNRALILSRYSNDVDCLAAALCSMVRRLLVFQTCTYNEIRVF